MHAAHHSHGGMVHARKDHMARGVDGGRVKGDQAKPRADRPMRAAGGFIKGAIKHPGALHRQLGVSQNETIPEKKLEKAAHSDNPTLRKRAVLAKTLKSFH